MPAIIPPVAESVAAPQVPKPLPEAKLRRRIARQRGGRGSVPEPYASIAPTLLGSARVRRLSATALRLYLYAHAGWHPEKPLILPVRTLTTELHIEPGTIAKARKELINAGLLVQTRAPIRPGAAGSQCGRTAGEYELIGRRSGSDIPRDAGDATYRGFWKISVTNLRALCCTLDAQTLRLLACIIVPQHRTTDGEIDQPPRIISRRRSSGRAERQGAGCFTAAGIAIALAISKRTAERALKTLLRAGLICDLRPASGCRAGIYAAHGLAADALTFAPWRPEDRHGSCRQADAAGRTPTSVSQDTSMAIHEAGHVSHKKPVPTPAKAVKPALPRLPAAKPPEACATQGHRAKPVARQAATLDFSHFVGSWSSVCSVSFIPLERPAAGTEPRVQGAARKRPARQGAKHFQERAPSPARRGQVATEQDSRPIV